MTEEEIEMKLNKIDPLESRVAAQHNDINILNKRITKLQQQLELEVERIDGILSRLENLK